MSILSSDINNKTLNGSYIQSKEMTSLSKKKEKSDYLSSSISCDMDVIERKSYYADVKPRPSLSSYKNNHPITSQNGGSDFKYLALSRRINLGNLNSRLSHMSENCSIKKNYLKSISLNDELHRAGKNVPSNAKNLKCIPESQFTENILNLKHMNKIKLDQDVKSRGINKWNSSVSLNVNNKSHTSKLNDPRFNAYLINNISSNEKLDTKKNSTKSEIENKTTNKVISKNITYKNNENSTNNIKVKSEQDKCVTKNTRNTLVSVQTNSVTVNSHTRIKHNLDNFIDSKNISNNTTITSDIPCYSNHRITRHTNLNSTSNNLKNKNSKSTSSINITKNNITLNNKNHHITNTSTTIKTTTNSATTSNYNRTISSDSSSSCISRRLLPSMVVTEKVLEEKRNILSKRLEQKMIRKVSGKFRKANIRSHDDSEENRSMTSYEVAGIMERAGPMGVYESDYEENGVSVGEEEEEEEEEMYKSKKNKMTSLFDAMKNDLLISDDDDDDEMKGSGDKTSCHQFKHSTQVDKKTEPLRGFMPYSKLNIPSELDSDIQFSSLKSNIPPQTDNSSQNPPPDPLSLFAILQSASFTLIPVVISPEQYANEAFNSLQNAWEPESCSLKLSRTIIYLEIPTKTIKTRSSVIKKKYSAMVIEESLFTAPPLQQLQENIQSDDVLLEVDGCVVGRESCLQMQRHIINLMTSPSTIHLVLARKNKS